MEGVKLRCGEGERWKDLCAGGEGERNKITGEMEEV